MIKVGERIIEFVSFFFQVVWEILVEVLVGQSGMVDIQDGNDWKRLRIFVIKCLNVVKIKVKEVGYLSVEYQIRKL